MSSFVRRGKSCRFHGNHKTSQGNGSHLWSPGNRHSGSHPLYRKNGMVAANIRCGARNDTQDGKDAQVQYHLLSNYSPNLCRNVRMDCRFRLVCPGSDKNRKPGQVLASVIPPNPVCLENPYLAHSECCPKPASPPVSLQVRMYPPQMERNYAPRRMGMSACMASS